MVKILIPTTKQRRERLHKCMATCSENAGMPHEIVVFENQLGGFVKAIRVMAESCNPNDIVLIANDDIIFGKDWLITLYDAFVKAFPDGDGFVMGDDGVFHGDHATLPLTSAWCITKFCYSGYHHNFCDWEWYHIAKQRGKFLYVPESKVIHDHWSRGNVERDETYMLQEPYFELDKNLFWERYAESDGFKHWEQLDGYKCITP